MSDIRQYDIFPDDNDIAAVIYDNQKWVIEAVVRSAEEQHQRKLQREIYSNLIVLANQ